MEDVLITTSLARILKLPIFYGHTLRMFEGGLENVGEIIDLDKLF
jgi:hypothetical protein